MRTRAIDWGVSYSRFLRRNTVLLERSIDCFDVNQHSTNQVVPRFMRHSLASARVVFASVVCVFIERCNSDTLLKCPYRWK